MGILLKYLFVLMIANGMENLRLYVNLKTNLLKLYQK